MRFPEFSNEWENNIVKNVLKYEQPIKYIVNNEEYLKSGIPVLTANKSFILGYTRENTNICKKECFIFDDFTLDMKYVNFPFKVKSSAIKIITADKQNNIYFWYNYLKRLNLVFLSHNRHWISQVSLLQVKVPNIDEQSKIANFLSLIDKRIELQNKIIRDYELLKKLLMNKFLSNFNLREISIYSLAKSQLIRIIKASELKKFNGTKSYLSTSSIDENGSISSEKEISFFDRPSRASMIPYRNSVWFARMKDTNKVYISKNNDEEKYILSTGFYGILPTKNDIDPIWLFEIFKSKYFIVQKDKLSEGGTMSGIKDSQLNELNIKIWLDKEMQNFACKLLKSFTKIMEIELHKENSLVKLKSYLLKTLFI